MKNRKKNKRKLSKNFKNFLFIILLVISCSFIYIIYNEDDSMLDKDEPILDESIDTNKDKQVSKTEENDKYSNYKKTSNYKVVNLERYIAYKKDNPKMSYEEVVTYVNIGLDKDFYSDVLVADTSYDELILMNKYNKLEKDYEPSDLVEINSKYFINGNTYVRLLRKEAHDAFVLLSKASIKNNTPVYGQSAYRDYSRQKELYDYAVNTSGKKSADKDTARPGYSEHQTGLAIDVSSTKDGNMFSFDKTDSFKWMQNNAYKYGFILRYRDDKTNVTGYMYESWHYRYVGEKVATDMHDNYPDLTYDEYYYKFIEK